MIRTALRHRTRATRRRTIASVAAVGAMLALALGVQGAFVGQAGAAPVGYTVSATSGQFVLKKGDATNQRTIANPTAVLTATADDQTGAFTGTAAFDPSFTPNQLGPFGIVIYIKAQILQATPFTGTILLDGSVQAAGQVYLAIGVYRTTTGTVGQSDGQNPATDQVLALSSTCRSLIDLNLTGTYNFASRVLTLGQDPFNIPNFPADTRSTGGNAGCTSATASLNQQLAGPSNSVSLTFGGTAALPPAAFGPVTATAGNGQATLSGMAPADYGSPITSYTLTPYLAGIAQPTRIYAPTDPPVVTGLLNGGSYTFTIAATNANGTGAASAQSNAVQVGAPARPGFQSATAGPGNATVRWWPPQNNGSPILSYTVTPFVAGVAQASQTFLGTSNQVTVTGLTPATTYTFTIVATNVNGTGPASSPTNAVVPT